MDAQRLQGGMLTKGFWIWEAGNLGLLHINYYSLNL